MRPRPLLTAALTTLSALAVATPALATAALPDDGGSGTTPTAAVSEDFTKKVLTTGLADPFEVLYGPDGKLWVTERTGGRVTQVDPATGDKTTILTIDGVMATPGEQDGLLGMALHPDLLDGKKKNQYVYLSYTYDGGGVGPAGEELDRRQRLVQYTYDAETNTLVEPTTLIEGMPASDDHNSGRLVFGPDKKLYYTIGDRGNNQDLNAYKPNEAQRLPTQAEVDAQDWTAYQGKTLRLNLDGSIPKDNPKLDGVTSHVFTYGHRNPQGLTFGEKGQLYSSEQGPKSDDELNLLKGGGNYGWPYVAGYKDDQAYVFGDWSAGTTLPYDAFTIPDEVPQYAEHDFDAANFEAPLRSYFTVANNHDFKGDDCDPSGLYFICYPTIAPSSLEYYGNDAIPGWENSLLMPTLKSGEVYRVELTDKGEQVGESQPLWRSVNRYRDTAISPDGTTIVVATDSAGLARGTDGDATKELENPGALLTFAYTSK